MQLWEQGRFGLDEPLAKFLPEYGKAVVVTGVVAAGKPLLKAPAGPILIRTFSGIPPALLIGPATQCPSA